MELKHYTKAMDKFFEFEDKYSRSTVQAGPVDSIGELTIDLIRGCYKVINFPLAFQQEYGNTLTDILGTGHCNLYLISDKFKKVLEENHLTGWKTFPISLMDKEGKLIPGYHGFSITGTCDFVDFSHSTIIEKQFVKNGPIAKFYKGLKVTPNFNADFFMAPESLRIFISTKAAFLFKKNKIKKLVLTPVDQIELDCANIDPYLRPDKTRL